jgi:aminoglycoside phosphotransferase (APT) family kinase protein
MQREIAVLTTLADSGVPHPRFVRGCQHLDVLGVVFYLMEDVDGFNPGTEVSDAHVRDAGMRHQVGLNYAADLARLGRARWQGLSLESLQRPGSFLARQVPGFLSLLNSYRELGDYSPESLPDVGLLAQWLLHNRPYLRPLSGGACPSRSRGTPARQRGESDSARWRHRRR